MALKFSELKINYTVYLLNRNTITAETGKVISVSNPRFSTPIQPMANPFDATAATTSQVVDVTIEVDGKQTTYTIPENLDMTYASNDIVLATDRELILREVENIKSKNEEELARAERRKKENELCDHILTEWNPVYKEKRQTEARFAALESGLGDMKTMMKAIIDKLS